MAAAKGTRPPNAGKGRKKGVPNKVNTEIKDMIAGALSEAGGQKYLVRQARKNPNAFLGLVGRILPRDITVGGDPKNPVQINHATSPAAIQAVSDLIRAIAGVRASLGNAQADQDGSLLPASLCDESQGR